MQPRQDLRNIGVRCYYRSFFTFLGYARLDQLDITGLAISTRIGIYAWEQRIAQRLILDINIPIDLSQCNNDLGKTIDYDNLSRRITTYVEEKSFDLIETVAEEVAAIIKKEFKVHQVTLKVSKPDAIKNAANVSVRITR